MSEIDVQAKLLEALQARWQRKDGTPNLGGRHVLKWDTSQVKLKLVTIDYMDLQPHLGTVVLRENTISNDSPATVTKGFDYSKEVTDTFAWHITGGLKVGGGAKATVGLPLVGEGEINTSVELSVEGGSVTTHSETVTWKDSTSVEVPPYTDIHVRATISTGTVSDVSFKGHVIAYGNVGAYVHYGTDDYTWMWGDLDTGHGWSGESNSSLKKLPLDPADREFTLEGLFSGTVGYSANITTSPITPSVGATPSPHGSVAS